MEVGQETVRSSRRRKKTKRKKSAGGRLIPKECATTAEIDAAGESSRLGKADTGMLKRKRVLEESVDRSSRKVKQKKRRSLADGEQSSNLSKSLKEGRSGRTDGKTNVDLTRVTSPDDVGPRSAPAKAKSGSRSFLDKMRARLSGGHFRMLNESLYTCKGDEAFELFQQKPGSFEVYHAGYQEQMSRWPVLPVAVVIRWLQTQDPNLVVADFGCGDARLAKTVKNKVFSLDLVSADSSVIACNMAKTPLDSTSVDVAVFCLSLMGTDYPTYLQEAFRVLKPRGRLIIAEVKSRLHSDNGGAGSQAFVTAIMSLGYVLISQDDSNTMFHMFHFRKEVNKQKFTRNVSWPVLKACIYKRR